MSDNGDTTTQLKIIFIGTFGDFSLKPLKAIMSRYSVVGIIESAPREARHTHKPIIDRLVDLIDLLTGKPSLSWIARRNHIPYLYLSAITQEQLIPFIENCQADIGVIASMNQLLPEQALIVPPLGFINLHPSLLPKYRGPNVWFWYYHQMDSEAGVTIHQVDKGEDTGDILNQESFPISLGMPPEKLISTSIELGNRMLLDTLEMISGGKSLPRSQREDKCHLRARHLKPGENLFDWQSWSLEHIFHFIRGVHPWYRIFRSEHGILGLLDWTAVDYEEKAIQFPSGRIHLDQHGVYFSHPSGRVYLRLRPTPIQILLALVLLISGINLIIMQLAKIK